MDVRGLGRVHQALQGGRHRHSTPALRPDPSVTAPADPHLHRPPGPPREACAVHSPLPSAPGGRSPAAGGGWAQRLRAGTGATGGGEGPVTRGGAKRGEGVAGGERAVRAAEGGRAPQGRGHPGPSARPAGCTRRRAYAPPTRTRHPPAPRNDEPPRPRPQARRYPVVRRSRGSRSIAADRRRAAAPDARARPYICGGVRGRRRLPLTRLGRTAGGPQRATDPSSDGRSRAGPPLCGPAGTGRPDDSSGTFTTARWRGRAYPVVVPGPAPSRNPCPDSLRRQAGPRGPAPSTPAGRAWREQSAETNPPVQEPQAGRHPPKSFVLPRN